MSREDLEKNKTDAAEQENVPSQEGDEIRGDKIYVSARKFNRPELFRRTGNHKASGMVIEKDARAKVMRAYTSTSK